MYSIRLDVVARACGARRGAHAHPARLARRVSHHAAASRRLVLRASAGRYPEALALSREALRASTATGDWRLEVIARHNLGDLLWEMGPIEDAAREAAQLALDMRSRPAAENDMDMLYANLMGILSEIGRIDEASAAATTGLPLMRRSRRYFTEEWAYLFWRRGQLEAAATLLGAVEAETVRSGTPPQPNEARLLAQARPALEGALAPESLRPLPRCRRRARPIRASGPALHHARRARAAPTATVVAFRSLPFTRHRDSNDPAPLPSRQREPHRAHPARGTGRSLRVAARWTAPMRHSARRST